MKSIPKTPRILDLLAKALGSNIEPDKYSVFEATLFNTLPLRKNHPLYKKAVASKNTLTEMKTAVSQETLPLHIMHNNENLPIGRVFHAELVNYDNELRGLFFIDNSVHADKVQLVENGTVDQVSVGMYPKHLLCSECKFDFMGPEASLVEVITGTCPNGHKMGDNGYAIIEGLDTWKEVSLVDMGGVKGARIHSPITSLLASESGNLEVSELFYLQASMERTMENELLDVKAKLMELESKLDEKLAKIHELTNGFSMVEEAVKALKEGTEKIDLFAASFAQLITKMDEFPKSQSEIKKMLSAAQEVLKDVVKHGPVSKDAVNDASGSHEVIRLTAFKVKE